jgi:hypothetical protein
VVEDEEEDVDDDDDVVADVGVDELIVGLILFVI